MTGHREEPGRYGPANPLAGGTGYQGYPAGELVRVHVHLASIRNRATRLEYLCSGAPGTAPPNVKSQP